MEFDKFANYDDDARPNAWLQLSDADRFQLMLAALDKIEDWEGFGATVKQLAGNGAREPAERLREVYRHADHALKTLGIAWA